MFTILWHMVWPQCECRSEVRCTRLAANTGRKKSPSRHHRTTLSGHIFATKACIDNRKKTCYPAIAPPHSMVNFDPLTADIGSGVWGTPGNFFGFRVLAALLHGIQQWASAKLCGVERRAPPMFGRATITTFQLCVFCLCFRKSTSHIVYHCDSFNCLL